MSSKHTPTPWRTIRDYQRESRLSPYEPNKEHFIGVQMGSAGGFTLENCPQRSENAAFIVRACNSHDELVEALTDLLHDWKDVTKDTKSMMVVGAELALAKAKGEV